MKQRGAEAASKSRRRNVKNSEKSQTRNDKTPNSVKLLMLAILASSAFMGIIFGHWFFPIDSTKSVQIKNKSARPILTAYVPEYRLDHVRSHIEWLGPVMDELILFSAQVSQDGSVLFSPDAPGLSKEQVRSMVQAAKSNGIERVLITIGGGGRSGGFSNVVISAKRREIFSNQLLELCEELGIGGIDLDWEGKMDMNQFTDYIRLIADMKKVLAPAGLLVTVALHDWHAPAVQALPEKLAIVADRVHVMAYDMVDKDTRGHASLKRTKAAIEGFIATKRIDPSKLAIGVPLYGRGIIDPSLVQTYEEMTRTNEDAGEAALSRGDDETKDQRMWINGRESVKVKAEWARSVGLDAVMAWEAGQDTLGDSELSLLVSIAETLRQ